MTNRDIGKSGNHYGLPKKDCQRISSKDSKSQEPRNMSVLNFAYIACTFSFIYHWDNWIEPCTNSKNLETNIYLLCFGPIVLFIVSLNMVLYCNDGQNLLRFFQNLV